MKMNPCLGALLLLAVSFPALAQNADKPPDSPSKSDVETEIKALQEEMRRLLDRQDQRLKSLEDIVKRHPPAQTGSTAAPPDSSGSPAAPAVAANQAGAISVCHQGCNFQDLQQAVNAAPPGGVVTVAAETNGSCAVLSKPVTIRGLRKPDGTGAHLVGGVCIGKGPLVVSGTNIHIENLEISGVEVGDGNGACIRIDPGARDITIVNIHCHDSQDGILGGYEGSLLLEDSRFERNGFDGGRSHSIYLTHGGTAVIRRITIFSTKGGGHSLKSGVQNLLLEDSTLAALGGNNSRALDIFGGGNVVLRHNVIQQGPMSDNNDMLGYALEPARLLPSGHQMLLDGNWWIFDDQRWGQTRLLRGRKLGPTVARNNEFVGVSSLGMDGVVSENNRWADGRQAAGLPNYDGTAASLPKAGNPPFSSGQAEDSPGFSPWKWFK